MSETKQSTHSSLLSGKGAYWTGWGISGLVAALMLFSASLKLTGAAQAVEGLIKAGYPESSIAPIGALELLCVILFMVPRTAVVGAALTSAYLGGAAATHVRASESPAMAIVIGVVLWIAVWLRTADLRAVFPLVAKK